MSVIEKTGRTVDEAVQEALSDLGVSREAVDIVILEEATKGLFGILGGRQARVRVTVKKPKAATGQAPVSTDPTGSNDVYEDEPEPASVPIDEQDDAAEDLDAETGPQRAGRDRDDSIDAARLFITGILDRLDLDCGIEIREDDDDIVHFHIRGEGMGLVIGKHGQTLDSIQYLANMVANKEGGRRVRVVIDAEGYRERREVTLTNLALRLADRTYEQRRKTVLEPMSALERRIIHLTLQDSDKVETYSEGEDPYRRVVIEPRAGS